MSMVELAMIGFEWGFRCQGVVYMNEEVSVVWNVVISLIGNVLGRFNVQSSEALRFWKPLFKTSIIDLYTRTSKF